MAKILFITDAPMIGGGEVYLREMLPRLQSQGLEVACALPANPGLEPIAKALSAANVPVFRYTNLSEVPADFALILASAWYPQSYAKFEARFGSIGILVHDQIDIFYPFVLRKAYRLGYQFLQVPNLKKAKAVITVSQWAAHYLKEVFGIAKAEGVNNGIDVEKYRPADPATRDSVRQQLGWNGFSVLVPARLSPEKNHYAVLAAAKALHEVRFYIAGKGELEPLWQQVARWMRLDNVEFMGRRDDMPLLYQAADAVIQPTLGENQSLATLEAMSSGALIVTTDIPAQREIVQDKLTGLLVPANSTAVVKAIEWAQNNPQSVAQIKQAARDFVLAHHTLEQSAQNLGRALKEILANAV